MIKTEFMGFRKCGMNFCFFFNVFRRTHFVCTCAHTGFRLLCNAVCVCLSQCYRWAKVHTITISLRSPISHPHISSIHDSQPSADAKNFNFFCWPIHSTSSLKTLFLPSSISEVLMKRTPITGKVNTKKRRRNSICPIETNHTHQKREKNNMKITSLPIKVNRLRFITTK